MKNRIAMTVIQQAIFSFSWCVRVNKVWFQFDTYGSWSQVAMWLERPWLDSQMYFTKKFVFLTQESGCSTEPSYIKDLVTVSLLMWFYFIQRSPVCMLWSTVGCPLINRFMTGVWRYLLCTEREYCIQFIFIF